MDPNTNHISRIHEIITKGIAGAICLPSNPSLDCIAASCALYLGLNKLGKTISLVASSQVNNPDIIASDKIQTSIATGGDNLVISFPYSDGSIDKVDYNIQGNSFNLIITPRPNYPKLDTNQVKYSYTGGKLDFVIVIDSPTLNNLGNTYKDNQNLFQGKDIVNIDRHLTNSFFGTVNFVNKTSSSIAELILEILKGLQVEIDKDMATDLYIGISTATNNFTSYSVNANTFETVAQLLRLGAIKKNIRKQASAPFQPNNFNYQPFNPSLPSPTPKPVINTPPSREFSKEKPIDAVENEVNPEEPPSEWLKPKIFRGGDLI